MTIEQTTQIMDILTTAYPQFYGGRNAPDPEKALVLWSTMFENDEVAIVAAAVKALVASDDKGFPPHIGAVKARIRLITQPQAMTEGEAWALVLRALKRSAYGSADEFERLPLMLRKLVGSASQLRDWALMDYDTVSSVVASNFQRSYRARVASQREYDALPGDVRVMMDSIAGALAIPEEPRPKTAAQLREALEGVAP